MGGIDEALEPIRTAVGWLNGKKRNAVVAPAVLAGEFGDRHQLDVRDAEFDEVVEAIDCGVEGALAE